QPSTRPNVSRVAFIAALTEAGSETSQIRVSTLPGPADMVAAALLFFSPLRPQIETLQPCAFSACAMPRPMPPLPPVMTAVRPVRSKMLIGCFHLVSRALSRAPCGGQMFRCNHGQACPENQIWAETSGPIFRAAKWRVNTSHEETMQFKHVTLDFDGPVAILKLDHQEVMNAVSMDMLGGLGEALDAIDDKRDEVRCLVLTGAGRAFCTGANLQGRNNQKPGKSNAGQSLEIGFHPVLRRLRRLHCPIVS